MIRQVSIYLLLYCSVFVFAEDKKVTIHVDKDYRPFSYSDGGVAKGMYIDVLRVAFSRMDGFQVNIEPVTWNRGKHMMEEGEGFGLTPAFFHGHDWPYLYPYSLPYYTETIVAVCNENVMKPPRDNWPVDYIGLKVGNVAGFDGWGGEQFRELVQQGKISYQEAKGSAENILKLGAGRVDCILMEDKAFDYTYKTLKASGDFSDDGHQFVKGAFVGQDPVYIGYSNTARKMGKNTYQFEFMQAFDSQIYKMVKAGEIKKIMDAYQD